MCFCVCLVCVWESNTQTDPLGTLMKYELLRCSETRSLWLNFQRGPPPPRTANQFNAGRRNAT